MDLRKLLALVLLACLWGPSFLFIRRAVEDIPPFTLVAGRMIGAGALLYVLLRMRGGALPREARIWRHMAFIAFAGTALPFVLVSWAEQYVDSAVASILNATVPIFTLVLAHFMTEDDRLTPTKGVGVALGLSGTVFLIVPALHGGMRMGALGIGAITIASVLYAISGVYARIHVRGLEPLVAPTMQFMISTLYVLPFSLAIERPWSIDTPSFPALASWLGLTLIGTVAAFVLYYRLLEQVTASALSMVTYLIPIIAVALGVLVANESLEWTTYAGCAAILLGVVAVNRRVRPRVEAAPT